MLACSLRLCSCGYCLDWLATKIAQVDEDCKFCGLSLIFWQNVCKFYGVNSICATVCRDQKIVNLRQKTFIVIYITAHFDFATFRVIKRIKGMTQELVIIA